VTTAGPFTLLIDNACPLCRREGDLLRRLDRGRGRLRFEDISSPGFDAARHGTTLERVMGEMHGVLPDGSIVTGVEVFRRAYAAVGWGWVLAPTAWPGLRWISDRAYTIFARYRPLLRRDPACQDGRCVRPADARTRRT
jgi:predicted DCC family thiol-disulfide oxidoreductase YuxK